MKTESMLSAGIDIGTTTTHLVISRIGIGVMEGFGTVPSVHITSKKVLFKSDVVFTPLLPDGKIDARAVTAIIKEQYKKAGVTPDELKCGAVIVTGESACRENASEVISSVSEFAGDFIAAQAGSELESYLSGKGAGADVISENEGKCTANVDIGGGTTNISVFVNGSCVETCCLNIGGRLVRKSNDDGIFISSSLLNLCRANDIKIKSFDDADSINSIHKLCSILASKIKEALGFCKEKTIETELITDSLLSGKYIPEIITFSGGVSECMQEKTDNSFKYGDIGVILADEIRNDTETYPCKVITELDTAREIGPLLNAKVVCVLIGERPGLLTDESMSAYIAYKPHPEMSESDYTVISNISRFGMPPVEAAAYAVDVIKAMLEQKCSGYKLKL